MMNAELKEMVRSLRVRLEEGDETDWLPPALRPVSGDTQDVSKGIEDIASSIRACRVCPLGETRLKAVPGVGSPNAEVMFIGEGPGFDEDHKGEPFVGKSGQLLDKIMGAIGLSRKTVFIANIVKCHPMKDPGSPESRGNDRPPTPEETAACRHFLDAQIRLIAPKVIMTLGAVPAKALLGEGTSVTRVRGRWTSYRLSGEPETVVKVLPTFHPAALLRNPDLKRDVWNDMKSLRDFLKES